MKYRKIDKYKYQLAEDEIRQIDIKGLRVETPFIELWFNGEMKIKKGYAWNGSNWSIDYKSITASAFHDAGYQLMRIGGVDIDFRQHFDLLYRDILLEKGLVRFHANFRYNMLRAFGGTSAKLTGKPEDVVFEE